MSLALIVLRLLVAFVLLCHASQKSLGWFGGKGLTGQAEVFDSLGMRPGRAMVLVASVTEVLAAMSIGLGFLLPLGVAGGAATMTVAGATMHTAAKAVWNARGGGEYPYFIAVVIAAVGFAGAGAWSIDGALGTLVPGLRPLLEGVGPGVVALVLAALGTVPFLSVLRRSHEADRRASEGEMPNRLR